MVNRSPQRDGLAGSRTVCRVVIAGCTCIASGMPVRESILDGAGPGSRGVLF